MITIPKAVQEIVAIHAKTIIRYDVEIRRAKALDARFGSGQRYQGDVEIEFEPSVNIAVPRLREMATLARNNSVDPIEMFAEAGITEEQIERLGLNS